MVRGCVRLVVVVVVVVVQLGVPPIPRGFSTVLRAAGPGAFRREFATI